MPGRHKAAYLVIAALALGGALYLLLPGKLQHQHTPSQPAPAGIAPASPYDPDSGLAPFDARPVPADARCPVCGMYPARYPRWAAQLIYQDGAAQFFDSPLELFVFLHGMARYSAIYTRTDVAVSYVTDAGNGAWIDARQAVYVQGSNLLGPMRNHDLPAFSTLQGAEAFAAEHGGQIIGLEQITPELLARLGHAMAHH
jgi:nitrous oxide reductase accessory protein NosL